MIENVLAWAPPGTKAAFYRTAAGAEVDLLLEIPGQRGIWAIEIKRDLSVSVSKGFHNSLEDLKPERSFVVCSGESRYTISKEIEVIGLLEMAVLLEEFG